MEQGNTITDSANITWFFIDGGNTWNIWKISTSFCPKVPMNWATCLTPCQMNQNTNVPGEVCKVPMKTSGLFVITWMWPIAEIFFRAAYGSDRM